MAGNWTLLQFSELDVHGVPPWAGMTGQRVVDWSRLAAELAGLAGLAGMAGLDQSWLT